MHIFWILLALGCSNVRMLSAQEVAINTASNTSVTIAMTASPLDVANANTTASSNSTEAATSTTEGPQNSTSTTAHPTSSTTPAPKVNQYNQKHKIMLVLMSDVNFREFGKQQGPAAVMANKKPPKNVKKPEKVTTSTTTEAAKVEQKNETACITTTTPAPSSSDMNCDESFHEENYLPSFAQKLYKFPEPIACETLSREEPPLHHAHDFNCYFPAVKALRFKLFRRHGKNQRRSYKPQDMYASIRKPKPYFYDYDYKDQYDENPWLNYDSREDLYYPHL